MFEIKVNGVAVQLLQPVKDIKSLVIQHMRGIPIPVDAKQTKAIAEWLYNITQAVDGLIEYNGSLMDKGQITKPAHMS